jgi:hypothetical protein
MHEKLIINESNSVFVFIILNFNSITFKHDLDSLREVIVKVKLV